jgi:signal transduction histidine kinase
MKKLLLRVMLLFMIAASLVFFIGSRMMTKDSRSVSYRQQLVDLNEIIQLSEREDEESQKKLEQSVDRFRTELINAQSGSNKEEEQNTLYLLYGLCLSFLLLVFAYVYIVILKPFDKLQNFAQEISKGNFEINLKYERTNYFGAFTWAFDHMRREIIKARACEKEAIDNNKTVIATLSHDIKTPISSIRAYAEGLDANLDSGPEKRRKYITVIMNKCDEVTKLTNDLFLHSLSDLDKLKMNTGRESLQKLMREMIGQMQVIDKEISLIGTIPDVYVNIDSKRFEQVLDNLINNAKKYAPNSRIEISSELVDGSVRVFVQDYGSGIPDEDMPFLFDKFYRGHNVGDNQGTGLGLYIVSYIMQQMEGSVSLKNSPEGLKVILSLPVIS